MGQPNEPTPAASSTQSTPAAQDPSTGSTGTDATGTSSSTATPATTAPAQQPTSFDPSTLPPEARAYIDQRVKDADYKARTAARQAAAEQAKRETAATIAQALNLPGFDGDAATPEELIEAAQSAAWASAVEVAMLRTAPADADRLLDSRRFLESLDDLVEVDPRAPEFAEQIQAKIRQWLEANPAPGAGTGSAPTGPTGLKPDPSQGGHGAPAPTRPASLSEAISRHYQQQQQR